MAKKIKAVGLLFGLFVFLTLGVVLRDTLTYFPIIVTALAQYGFWIALVVLLVTILLVVAFTMKTKVNTGRPR